MGQALAKSYSIMNKTQSRKKTEIKKSGEPKFPLDKRKPLMEAVKRRK